MGGGERVGERGRRERVWEREGGGSECGREGEEGASVGERGNT